MSNRRVNLNNDGDGMTNFEVLDHARRLKLPNFKYFMRNELRNSKPKNIECGIINLDNSRGSGTHHVCYWKHGNERYYFDSFGATYPKELGRYLGTPILYSTYQIQQMNQTNCSEWCLYVLNKLNLGEEFINIILDILNKHKLY